MKTRRDTGYGKRTLCFLLPTFYFLLCASAPGQAYPLTPGGLATTDIDTIAELNALVSDADVARTDAANTFTGTQTIGTISLGTAITTPNVTVSYYTYGSGHGLVGVSGGTALYSSLNRLAQAGTVTSLRADGTFGWTAGAVPAALDTSFSRNAAGIIQFGTTAANALGSWLATDGTLSGTLTIGGGTAITKVVSATGTLDFGSTAAGTSTDLTITVTGAALGNVVSLGVPNGSAVANSTFSQWVSATDTVTVRFVNNALVTAADPASGTFRVQVNQF